jgi:DNA repair protein RecO (recombination protein O)
VNRLQTSGTVLRRTDYGEADRIVTMLTPDYGKLRLMARGVRKPKSKLAGGIELFSVSDVTFIRGKGDIGTLISTRLVKHYGRIVNDIERVRLGYDLIKLLDKVTEDEPEPEYFELMEQALEALDDPEISQTLIRAWFSAQLLAQAGHSPNLKTDTSGRDLQPGQKYGFDFERMSFEPIEKGGFAGDDIKFLRLLFNGNRPKALSRVDGLDGLLGRCAPPLSVMLSSHIRT